MPPQEFEKTQMTRRTFVGGLLSTPLARVFRTMRLPALLTASTAAVTIAVPKGPLIVEASLGRARADVSS